tara:strand:- start:860 stop:1507 length:648 start_codon:yes stop_codon:yes gene_type:complete
MIKVLDKPLFIHIIDIYKQYGIKNVYILGGYKQEVFEDFLKKNYQKSNDEENAYIYQNMLIKLIDTGLESMTGTRILIGMNEVKEDNFYVTYGDGLCDVDINKLTEFHFSNNSTVTITAVNTPERFGRLQINDKKVINFGEKINSRKEWINGGFFVVNKDVKKYLNLDDCIFEKNPMEKLAQDGNLYAFKHDGFWQCVDTIRELEILESKLLDFE